MSANDLIHRLNALYTHKEISAKHYHLMEPLYNKYIQTMNLQAFSEKEIELIVTIYSIYFEAS